LIWNRKKDRMEKPKLVGELILRSDWHFVEGRGNYNGGRGTGYAKRGEWGLDRQNAAAKRGQARET